MFKWKLLVLFCLSRVLSAQVYQQGVYFMSPDLLAIHYPSNVELNTTSFAGGISVDSCTVSPILRNSTGSNIVALTLTSCSGTPSYLTIGNASLLTLTGGYVGNESRVTISEVFEPTVTRVVCQAVVGGSSIQTEFNDQRWTAGEVVSLQPSWPLSEVFYSGGGKFSFMVTGTEHVDFSARLGLSLTTVGKRVELDVSFTSCGLEPLSPSDVSLFDNQYLMVKYDTGPIHPPDISKLTLTCNTVDNVSRVVDLLPSDESYSTSPLIKIPIDSSCEDAIAYSLDIADGFVETEAYQYSAQKESVWVKEVSNPMITGHLCDNNVHYFPVSSAVPWRVTQIVDNGSCVVEAGYSSQAIDVVIDTPVNCILIFEIEVLSTETRSNSTVVIDYDCPYTHPSNGFADLPVVILVFFSLCSALSLVLVGLEIYWVAIGESSYIGTVIDKWQSHIEQEWMQIDETDEHRIRAIRFADD